MVHAVLIPPENWSRVTEVRVLVTNDDGVLADGLAIAESIAHEIAEPDGEVWTVAPEGDRSGSGRAVTYLSVIGVRQLAAQRFATTGTPTDCVIIGSEIVMESNPPDLVLSGVNRGHNVADDVTLSGTVGGAMEAAIRGFRGIALSQSYGTNSDRDDLWTSVREHGAEVVRRLLSTRCRQGISFNVNFPACAKGSTKGIRLARLGVSNTSTMQPLRVPSPRSSGEYFRYAYRPPRSTADFQADIELCLDGWITVTPLTHDITAYEQISPEIAANIESSY